MRRSLFLYMFLTVAVAASFASPVASLAAGPDKPLMTIRFNSDVVAFEQNLNRAVHMALDAKPNVFFDLVAISPETEDKSSNKKLNEAAKFQAEKIADQIRQSGVSPEMIRTSYQKNKFTKNNEIQIFVQ